MSIAGNLETIRSNIARAGRNPDEITIVAVTKGFGADVCRQAIDAGLTILGENRVQEALDKMRVVEGAQWHLIGHLQTNKAKAAAGHFAVIQSVDSRHLVDALTKLNPAQHVLIEVNVAREAQKTGADPDEALTLIEHAAHALDLRGLMAMGPTHGDPTPAFSELRKLRDMAQERLGKSLPILSMGMSGDYELAVKSGSTMLRLGTALFGPRPQ
ncbi:MAG TPA: YggS family pyridoxal phosphate-dependent enzyme [Candidatus Dormibacteraeota bacterium]|nr:YggS family pyridoxal phosphate-dependent enzyme [Candidatus Dormibacteraeota bacterium]